MRTHVKLRDAALGLIDTLLCILCHMQVLGLAAVRATPLLTQRCREIISTNLDIAEGFFARWQNIFDFHTPQVTLRLIHKHTHDMRFVTC